MTHDPKSAILVETAVDAFGEADVVRIPALIGKLRRILQDEDRSIGCSIPRLGRARRDALSTMQVTGWRTAAHQAAERCLTVAENCDGDARSPSLVLKRLADTLQRRLCSSGRQDKPPQRFARDFRGASTVMVPNRVWIFRVRRSRRRRSFMQSWQTRAQMLNSSICA